MATPDAGISVLSCISGMSRFMATNTVASTEEKKRIHRYFHLAYTSRPETIMKNEYQSLVSPVVRIGGL